MTFSNNALILALLIAIATAGYFYYQSRQDIVEIKLPNIKIERQ